MPYVEDYRPQAPLKTRRYHRVVTTTNPLSYLTEQLEAWRKAGTYQRLRVLESACLTGLPLCATPKVIKSASNTIWVRQPSQAGPMAAVGSHPRNPALAQARSHHFRHHEAFNM